MLKSLLLIIICITSLAAPPAAEAWSNPAAKAAEQARKKAAEARKRVEAARKKAAEAARKKAEAARKKAEAVRRAKAEAVRRAKAAAARKAEAIRRAKAEAVRRAKAAAARKAAAIRRAKAEAVRRAKAEAARIAKAAAEAARKAKEAAAAAAAAAIAAQQLAAEKAGLCLSVIDVKAKVKNNNFRSIRVLPLDNKDADPVSYQVTARNNCTTRSHNLDYTIQTAGLFNDHQTLESGKLNLGVINFAQTKSVTFTSNEFRGGLNKIKFSNGSMLLDHYGLVKLPEIDTDTCLDVDFTAKVDNSGTGFSNINSLDNALSNATNNRTMFRANLTNNCYRQGNYNITYAVKTPTGETVHQDVLSTDLNQGDTGSIYFNSSEFSSQQPAGLYRVEITGDNNQTTNGFVKRPIQQACIKLSKELLANGNVYSNTTPDSAASDIPSLGTKTLFKAFQYRWKLENCGSEWLETVTIEDSSAPNGIVELDGFNGLEPGESYTSPTIQTSTENVGAKIAAIYNANNGTDFLGSCVGNIYTMAKATGFSESGIQVESVSGVNAQCETYHPGN